VPQRAGVIIPRSYHRYDRAITAPRRLFITDLDAVEHAVSACGPGQLECFGTSSVARHTRCFPVVAQVLIVRVSVVTDFAVVDRPVAANTISLRVDCDASSVCVGLTHGTYGCHLCIGERPGSSAAAASGRRVW